MISILSNMRFVHPDAEDFCAPSKDSPRSFVLGPAIVPVKVSKSTITIFVRSCDSRNRKCLNWHKKIFKFEKTSPWKKANFQPPSDDPKFDVAIFKEGDRDEPLIEDPKKLPVDDKASSPFCSSNTDDMRLSQALETLNMLKDDIFIECSSVKKTIDDFLKQAEANPRKDQSKTLMTLRNYPKKSPQSYVSTYLNPAMISFVI